MIRKEIENSSQKVIDCSCISHIERVGGMTNKNYKVIHNSYGDTEVHIFRSVDDSSVGSIIDRNEELFNTMQLAEAQGRGELDSIVVPQYLDETGVKITKFIPHTKMDVRDSYKLKLALDSLSELHNSKVDFLARRTCFYIARTYANQLRYLLFNNPNDEVECSISRLHQLISMSKIEKMESEYTRLFKEDYRPCHIDTVPDNFFVCKDKAVLNDFEYACMSDKYWDIVNLMSESGAIHLEDIIKVVQTYTGEVLSIEMVRRLEILNIMNSYCWYLWSLMDQLLNDKPDLTYRDTKLDQLCMKLLREEKYYECDNTGIRFGI